MKISRLNALVKTGQFLEVKTPVHKKRFIYQNVQFFNWSKNCCFVCDHF